MRLGEAHPIDIDIIVKKKEALTLRENKKDPPYEKIAFAVLIIVMGMVMALIILSKVDLSGLLGGLGGGPEPVPAEPIPMMIAGLFR